LVGGNPEDALEYEDALERAGGASGVLESLVSGRTLDPDVATGCVLSILKGAWTPAQVGAFLAALRAKGEEVEEIVGFARGLRIKARKVHLRSQERVIDTCGTGGDGKRTFNVSTLSALSCAAAGAKVAKHGNRAASSSVGSADLLEGLGIRLHLEPEEVAAAVEDTGFGFMFAPAFHPALKVVAPIRRELAVPTVFNLLGPLVNPAGVRRQVIGVPRPDLGAKIAEAAAVLGAEKVLVITGQGGYDEATLAGPVTVIEAGSELAGAQAVVREVDPMDIGFARLPEEVMAGGNLATNVSIARDVLEGRQCPQADVVALNAAFGIWVAGVAANLEKAAEAAREATFSGGAGAVLERYRAQAGR
jgi:anthranilate phosphoribosyltransferase